MDDNEFSTNIIDKTIRKLSTSDKWIKTYTNLFQSLLDNDKLSDSNEIYEKVMEEVNDQ